MGYGLAGILRKIHVYPSYCLYPKSLVTITLNNSLHKDKNTPVQGPAQNTWTMSRFRFFMWAFASMFVYFWSPNYFFTALSAFKWIAWIAPNNTDLSAITGFSKGAGINPLPTFDWNIMASKGPHWSSGLQHYCRVVLGFARSDAAIWEANVAAFPRPTF